jgi:hypothetical protein
MIVLLHTTDGVKSLSMNPLLKIDNGAVSPSFSVINTIIMIENVD